MQSQLDPPVTERAPTADVKPGRRSKSGRPTPDPSAPRKRRREKLPYILMAPSVIIVLALMAYPLYSLVSLSMHVTPLAGRFAAVPPPPRFVWFQNFKAVLGDSTYWEVVGRTILFTAVAVGLSMGVSLGVALLMRRVSGWARIMVTIALVSVWAIPSIVATQVFAWLVDSDFGVVNYLINKIPGVNFTEHSWFSSPYQGWIVIVALVLWGAIPFLALTLYAGLTQVPTELIEAATLDGANARQILTKVIMPVLRPVLIITTTLSVIWDFGVFNQIFVLRNTQPEQSYWTVAIYAYEKAFAQSNYNMGATITVCTTILMIAVMVFYIRQMIRIGEAE
jgi:N,N'-diacetylchitobiose transport system permease protein